MRAVIGVALNNLAVLAAASYAHSKFDWASISPSKDLIYHDCFDGFKCARLIAPLDYKNDSDLRTVAIAMIKLPAVVSDDDRAFAGSVTNLGGPGGAGFGFILRAGKGLRDVLDKPGLRHYEIVSFDPRGIELRGRGPLDCRGGTNVPYILAIQKAIDLLCQHVEANGINGGQIMAYMGTPNVAHDMVHMVDKIAELRVRDAIYRKSGGDNVEDYVELKREINEGDDDIPRLQYIGYSYGTVFGIYFASLFPGRVGRIALDGVVDVNDYSSRPGWMTNLVDTDEIADRFFSGCHEVGRKICALSRNGDKSDASIKSHFSSWLSKLDEELISTIGRSGEIIVIRSQDIREMLGAALYRPRSSFIILATALDGAMGGDTAAIVKILFQRHIPHLNDVCAINDTGPDSETYLQEGTASVLCADGDSVSDYDIAWWKQTSGLIGFLKDHSQLLQLYIPPPEILFLVTPAAPILFISNRLDPVTPLNAARAMASKHPGAGLIITEGLGHGTMGTSDSVCLHSYVADYFDSGVVPAGEATCIPDCGPWDIDCKTFGVEIMPDNSRGYGRGPLAF
ncbi:TAP-like protein domain-containing protein [Trichoderma breve]|uniref:TAP-like protein domain-containing protein n=1 Tax=Trichoderma breve TaxID=2034170 RepID=A0A9W9BA15_9HYPO|nr:TAP-like protein domain-containing protein [Trichoderma breve]KAJ4859407.1 TAP-like protein domain-containing protein [Trichoderma breve]